MSDFRTKQEWTDRLLEVQAGHASCRHVADEILDVTTALEFRVEELELKIEELTKELAKMTTYRDRAVSDMMPIEAANARMRAAIIDLNPDYWMGIGECVCASKLPNGGCLYCDLKRLKEAIR